MDCPDHKNDELPYCPRCLSLYWEARSLHLQTQNARLREALAPFAKASDWSWEATIFKDPNAVVLQTPDGETVKRQDFEAAAKALAGEEGEL